MNIDEITALHKKYAPSPKVFDFVFPHCKIVCEIAEELIKKSNIQCDIELVKIGALIHDIGVYKVTDIDGVEDRKNYIRHGVEGYKILKDEGLPESLCRIAERHTGVGIRKDEILERNLPLPPKDYIAETIEEMLVMYADKFHSKNPDNFNSFESYKKFVSRHGEEHVKKFEELGVMFGKPDVEALAKKYNQPIF